MSTELAQITAIVSNDIVKKSDAVIWLTGDRLTRMNKVMRVYGEGLAEKIVISGGLDNDSAISASECAKELYKKNIAKENVIVENNSQNTFEQGTEIMKLVEQHNWKKIILVASHFHQVRAYVTFLKAMENANLKIEIFNSPARDLSWFEKTSLGKNRLELFEDEVTKIDAYTKKGHVFSLSDALRYQEWKESQK